MSGSNPLRAWRRQDLEYTLSIRHRLQREDHVLYTDKFFDQIGDELKDRLREAKEGEWMPTCFGKVKR